MKLKSPLKTLHDLETHYRSLLDGVRNLIALENGEQPIRTAQKDHGRNGETLAVKPFTEMTKGDAVNTILKEKGELHTSKIYNSMRKRGHPIASKNALATVLSTDKRFEKKGKGVWALAQQQ